MAIRAYYASLYYNTELYHSHLKIVRCLGADLDYLFDEDSIISASRDIAIELSGLTDRSLEYDLQNEDEKASELTLDNSLIDILDIAESSIGLNLESSLPREFDNSLDFNGSFEIACELVRESELNQQLEIFQENFIKEKRLSGEAYMWWMTDGEEWTSQLRELMLNDRGIGHRWYFSEEQAQLLKRYYYANFILIQCLNAECDVSREVRQEIEDTLLLPYDEIQKYKAAKA